MGSHKKSVISTRNSPASIGERILQKNAMVIRLTEGENDGVSRTFNQAQIILNVIHDQNS